MNPAPSVALKEWAVVCEALRQGRQNLLLRKGGIHEGPDGFRPEYDRFWLYPTRFHQSAEELQSAAHDLLQAVRQDRPPTGRIQLSLHAQVERTWHLRHESQLSCLDGLHILSSDIVRERFVYRRPGLFVMSVAVRELPQSLELDDDPVYAGCHSWVPLRANLPVPDLEFRADERRLFDEIAERLADVNS